MRAGPLLPTKFFFSLKEAIVLEVAGKDCTRYLNARLSNDIKSLANGRVCRAAALNPHGKVQALFQVLAVADSRYLLVCSGGPSEEVISAFKQYIVADRVEVRALSSELSLTHLAASDPQASQTLLASAFGLNLKTTPYGEAASRAGVYAYVNSRSIALGVDVLSPAASTAHLETELIQQGFAPLSLELQSLARISAGIPDFPFELNESRLLSEAPLEGIVSFNKGCYVGQEVVERIASQGRSPRLLRRIALVGSSSLAPGTPVEHLEPEQETPQIHAIGTIVSCAVDQADQQTFCFASIKNNLAASGTRVKVGDLAGSIL